MVQEFLKKFWLVLVGTLVVVVGTIVLLIRISSTGAQVRELHDKVQEILAKQKGFESFPWELKAETVTAAQAACSQAEAKLQKLQQELMSKDKYGVLDFSGPAETMTVPQLIVTLTQSTNALAEKLRRIQSNLAADKFGFRQFTDPGRLPAAGYIPAIRKQFEIMQQLVDIVSRSDIRTLDEMHWYDIGDDMTPKDMGDYNYVPYKLRFVTNTPGLQRFLQLLGEPNARFLFIVRRLDVSAANDPTGAIAGGSGGTSGSTAPAGGGPGGGGAPGGMMGGPGMGMGMGGGRGEMAAPKTADATPAAGPDSKPKTKLERIVFDKLVDLRVDMTLDYIEFKIKQ